jgi:hypothetical protein
MAQAKKIKYEAPKVKKIGDFETITKGNHTGSFIDADFNAHTPANQLTFS